MLQLSSHLGSASLEILSCLSQGGGAHEILTILELAALLKKAFAVSLHIGLSVGVGVLVHVSHDLRHVVPVDLELGHTGLLSQDVSVETLDHWLLRRVLVELGTIVLDVDVVADAKELL